ncbi:NADPH-dependent methylglyoxal reductase GRE2 protein [Ceratobasidium sp. AG-Ba]|nr:NADPH-dependent methylglyoxal reductase GRE2 protein [Ceratobasidium sp. AG-Ba]
MSGTTVLLTGGNGFIAVHIIVELLQRGYNVTTTVRSEGKTTYLRKKFSDAVEAGQLKFAIVEDITVPGAFNEVLKNGTFDSVIHSSSPVISNAKDVRNELLIPAIQGTTEILKAVKAHAPTVKRVVVTSSNAAIVDRSKGNRPGYVYSEKDWHPVTAEDAESEPKLGYFASKTLAEKAAWNFVDTEKPKFDLVTICPPMVYGPMIQEVTSMDNINVSSKKFYAIFSGQEKELTNVGTWIWVDVRDVAAAHVAALEKPQAGGHRFYVSAGNFNIAQVVDYIWEHYPERATAKGIPKSNANVGYPAEGCYTSDNSASKRVLGVNYRSLESTLKDQLEQFINLEKEIASRKSEAN